MRERRRHRWINALIVVAPVAFALVYVLCIATPRYEAESRFFVQSGSGQQSAGAGAAGLLTTGNMSGMLGGFVDGWAVSDFLKSRDCMRQLDQKVGLRRYLVDDGLDPANRLVQNASEDELYRAYQSSVKVSFNVLEQIDVLRVSAFSPEDAEILSKALIGLAEDFVSRLNEKGVADKLKVSQESVRLAEQKALEGQGCPDGVADGPRQYRPDGFCRDAAEFVRPAGRELSNAQVSLDKIRALGNKDHPMLKPAQMQVAALQKEDRGRAPSPQWRGGTRKQGNSNPTRR